MIINKNSLIIIAFIASNQVIAAETLEQAFTEALNQNQRILAAKANSEASEQQLYAAQGQRLPQLNVSTGYTQLSETPTIQTEVDGRPAEFAASQAGSANAQAIVSVPVFTSGRISHSIKAAETAKVAMQQNEITIALNIKLQVADAFIAIFRAQKGLLVAQSHVNSLNSHVNDVTNLYQQGMVARNDLLASQVELSNAEQDVIRKDNQLNIAKAHFNQLLNRDLSTEVDLVEQFPEALRGTLAELGQQALSQRPELSTLALQAHALEEQAASENASLWPQVNINGGYQYQQNRYQVHEGMWMANATLEWKIYDGSTRHRSKAMSQQAMALQSQRNDLISHIQLQVRQSWLDVQETLKRTEVVKSAIAQADENLKVSTERYQQGLASHTEVLDAEDLRVTTHNNFNNARYDAVMAKLNLRRALGTL